MTTYQYQDMDGHTRTTTGEPVAHQAHRHVTDKGNVYEVPDGVECPFCRIAAAPKQED